MAKWSRAQAWLLGMGPEELKAPCPPNTTHRAWFVPRKREGWMLDRAKWSESAPAQEGKYRPNGTGQTK